MAITNLPEGFARVEVPDFPPRTIIGVNAVHKHGKSHFGLSAPGPIAYFNFDKEAKEDILRKFSKKEIYAAKYVLEPGYTQDDAKDVVHHADNAMAEFITQGIRSLVVDTESQLYEYVRMAEFGRLEQVPAFMYADVNEYFRRLINQVHAAPGVNLILLRRLKHEYINRDGKASKAEKTGKMIPACNNDSPYLVQANLRLWRDDDGVGNFKGRILDSSQNPFAAGMEFMTVADPAQLGNPMTDRCNFPTIAAALTNTSSEVWA